MTDLTIRGNRHERRKAARLARKVQNGTSQRNITDIYQTWRKSGDPRADSITFREFSTQRPDQNADYVPARWAGWAQHRDAQTQPAYDALQIVAADETRAALDIAAQNSAELAAMSNETELAHEQFPDAITLDAVVQPDDLVVQLAANERPAKKQRKPRAKKSDEVAI